WAEGRRAHPRLGWSHMREPEVLYRNVPKKTGTRLGANMTARAGQPASVQSMAPSNFKAQG
ncbi:MAG: hypothetical protein WBX35_20125, partial [Pseudolabrys sp.]